MMKTIFSMLLILSVASAFGQNETLPDLKNIRSVAQAKALVNDFPDLKAYVYTYYAGKDTFPGSKKLFQSNKGDILKIGNTTYKILEAGPMKLFRVSYIYLDGSQLSLKEIDSLRRKIIIRYKKGTRFDVLAKEFTMDGNESGDTGEFGESMMVIEFETVVRRYKKGDVFTVDIPSRNWYYVVKKTYADRMEKGVKVLVIPNL